MSIGDDDKARIFILSNDGKYPDRNRKKAFRGVWLQQTDAPPMGASAPTPDATIRNNLRDFSLGFVTSIEEESVNTFMSSLIRKLFHHKSEASNDGLTQPQREAIVDLLCYCMYADNLIMLAEDRLITDTVAKFNWDSKLPFDQFALRSIDNARNAKENQGYREKFLASIRDRLDTAAVKGQALDLCQELFLADGARSDEEDVVLQNLRQLLR